MRKIRGLNVNKMFTQSPLSSKCISIILIVLTLLQSWIQINNIMIHTDQECSPLGIACHNKISATTNNSSGYEIVRYFVTTVKKIFVSFEICGEKFKWILVLTLIYQISVY